MLLADIQSRLRDAVVAGATTGIGARLVGGSDPAARLVIHARHYRASLVSALTGRFPACAWLVGERTMEEIAEDFVRAHPPSAPCIAEFGAELPSYIATQPIAVRIPYLAPFALMEWHVGRVTVAVEEPALPFAAMATVPVDAIADATVRLQLGTHLFEAEWPIDELMMLFVTDSVPSSFVLRDARVCVQLRGSRGEFRFERLSPSTFAFRDSLARGDTIEDAAHAAAAVDDRFEPGHSLSTAFADGLVTAIHLPHNQ